MTITMKLSTFEAVRLYRIRHKLSRAKASGKLGINPHTLRAYEAGRRSPPAEVVAKIERIINQQPV